MQREGRNDMEGRIRQARYQMIRHDKDIYRRKDMLGMMHKDK